MAGQETLQDRAIRHAAMLVRYEAGEARRILAIIDREMLPDLLDVFRRRMGRIDERGLDLGPMAQQETEQNRLANHARALVLLLGKQDLSLEVAECRHAQKRGDGPRRARGDLPPEQARTQGEGHGR